ncbi:MAG TPA: hypothetical protein VK175_16715 [Leadbetterella sp.]|nr:hypothetical protein [Leadbetterella sp.]
MLRLKLRDDFYANKLGTHITQHLHDDIDAFETHTPKHLTIKLGRKKGLSVGIGAKISPKSGNKAPNIE